jgi:hypothetical protein
MSSSFLQPLSGGSDRFIGLPLSSAETDGNIPTCFGIGNFGTVMMTLEGSGIPALVT